MSAITSRRTFLKASALLTGASVLAACAPAATPAAGTTESAPEATAPAAGKKKIVFHSYTWSGYEAAMRQVIEEWVATQPDIEFEGQFVPQDDYWTKVQTMVASGAPPDGGIADYGRVVSYAANGTLLPISEYLKAANFPLDSMFPGATAQYRWTKGEFDSGNPGGEYYGIPSDGQSQIFVYNKKMFDEAGVAYPTDDWTWDDMLAAAKTITKPDENKWGIAGISNYILLKGNYVFAAGGAIHNADFSKSMLADPGTIEAYKWNWDLIFTHKVAPPPGSLTSTNPFMTGQVAMYIEGVWWIPDFVAGIKDFEWDVAMFPKHPGTGKRTTTVESDGWWIYKGAKEPEATYKLIEALALPEGQKKFGELNYIVPSNIPEIAEIWYAKTPPANRMKALENINQDSAKVDFTYFEFGTITNAVMPIIEKAFADGEDITAALQEADTVMNEELTKAWELLKSS